MPFSLTNAPAVLQNLVNDVLWDMLNRFVFVNLGDILFFSRDIMEHQEHVRLVLQRLLENRLFMKAEKLDFHITSTSYLGFIIEKDLSRVYPTSHPMTAGIGSSPPCDPELEKAGKEN